jgi:hypothetical protein
MSDVRDKGLGAVLDRQATRIGSAPVDRLPEVLRRGSRLRAIRFTAIAAAVAVFAGAVSWAGLQNEGRGRIPGDIAEWRTFASLEDNGWTVQVPPPWRLQELPACEVAPQKIGVIVTNVDFEFLNPRGEQPQCEDRFVFHGFPSDGVAFAFMPVGIRFGSLFDQPDTTLPLTPDLLVATDGIQGGPAESFQSIWRGGVLISIVRRWVGPDASATDVAALDQMLASLRFPRAPRWVKDRIVQEGIAVTVAYPEPWTATTVRAPASEDAPTPLMLLTSPHVGGGPCSPFRPVVEVELGSLRDFGVAVLVSDGRSAWVPIALAEDAFPPRPDEFRFRDGEEIVSGCGPGFRVLSFRYEEAGIPIFLTAAVTETVYREQPEMLLHILNSIRVEEEAA